MMLICMKPAAAAAANRKAGAHDYDDAHLHVTCQAHSSGSVLGRKPFLTASFLLNFHLACHSYSRLIGRSQAPLIGAA